MGAFAWWRRWRGGIWWYEFTWCGGRGWVRGTPPSDTEDVDIEDHRLPRAMVVR